MITEADLESVLAENKPAKELGDSLTKLLRNSDFRDVVLIGYIREEAIKLVHLLSDPTQNKSEIQTRLDSISNFKLYLDTVISNSEMATRTIEETEEQLLLIRDNEV